MKYLNLTEGFNPYNAPESECIKFESFFFNGGEPHIKLDRNSFEYNGEDYVDVHVTSRITSMNDFMMLIIATEALSQIGVVDSKWLFIPYFPGARQDRRMILGEPLTVKVMADILNDSNYDEIITFDNHSDVSTALIDNCINLNNHEFVKYCIDDIKAKSNSASFIISPDAGANKKITSLAAYLNYGYKGIIKCDKTRVPKTGKIIRTEVYSNNLEGRDCYIVDDICDGGKTFIELSKALKKKNAGDIYLIVSHGIFSKPLKELKPYFKKIYTTDSWRSEFSWEQKERDATDLVEIVKFKDFM